MIAPKPPPTTGQTLATAGMLGGFVEQGLQVSIADTAPVRGRSWMALLDRLFRLATALVMIPLIRCRGTRAIYISVLANFGMYHTALCALLARILGYRVFFHHHAYNYIRQKRLRMSFLIICGGPKAVHINNCHRMSLDMKLAYPRVGQMMALSNVFLVQGPESKGKTAINDCQIWLGHMSNLTRQKGFFTVIEVYRHLRDSGINAGLIVAGPCYSHEIVATITSLKLEFPEYFEYVNYVEGNTKVNFFDRIDVFLFPSTYESETQGIVNLEALAAGVPVVAYGHCCTVSDIVPPAGLIVPLGRPFIDEALPLLNVWATDPLKLREASAAARRRFEELALAGRQQLKETIDRIRMEATD